MGKFTDRLARSLAGRYGGDRLNRFLTWVSVGVLFTALILRMLPISPWFSNGTYIFALLLVVWSMIRAFSRNIPARQREEQRFLKLVGKLLAPFRNARRRFKERKTHIYRKCPHCRKTLRLPRVPGNHTVRCPVCHNRFDLKVK